MRSLAACFALLLLAAPAIGAPDRDAVEARLDSILLAPRPLADSLFRLAKQAAAAKNHYRAVELYARVSLLVPGFGAAVRRQAHEQTQLGNRFEARALLDSLVLHDPDPLNEV